MPPRSLLKLAFVIGLLAVAPTPAIAERLPIRIYTTADGLASDSVYRVVADSQGFIWFGTNDGLSRFDGYTFATYTTRDGLPNRSVVDVQLTRDGALWVATSGGLCRLNPRREAGAPLFVVEGLGDGSASNDVNCLLETRDGSLWCGTNGGLYRLVEADGRWTASRIELGTDDPVTALSEGRWGEVSAGTLGKVHCVQPDTSVLTFSLPGVGSGLVIKSVYEDSEGALWIGTQYQISRSSPRTSASAPLLIADIGVGSPSGWGNAFFESRDGTLLVATTEGLWTRNAAHPRVFERRAALDGACAREIWDIAEDRDGNLWLATACGVLRVNRYGFTGYDGADGLSSVSVNSIFESNAGDLIVTTSDSRRLVHRWNGTMFTSVAPRPFRGIYPGWGWGQTVIQDQAGAWWVPSGVGAGRFPTAERPDSVLRLRTEPIFDGQEVFRIFEDSRGNVWLATIGPPSVLRWERSTGHFIDLTAETGLGVTSEFTSFGESLDGAVWVGTGSGGLLRFANGGCTRFTGEVGVPEGWIRAIYIDDSGRMWIASSRGGLARVDDPAAAQPRFVTYTMAEGLASDNVWSVVADRWGRIYAGTTRGVDRIDLQTGAVKHFTSADGLPKSNLHCAFRDRNGSLWFGSPFGLVRPDPEPERDRDPPRTLMTGLRVAGVAQTVSALGESTLASMELGPDENSVSLDFLGLGTSLGEELRYQHRLEGADSNWSVPSSERTVTFANLGPGTYRILVRAVDATNVSSPEPASFEFTVLAPVWRRGWFVALGVVLMALAAYGLYRYRVARLLEVERVRTHIATDLHDDIGANLTRIAFLSEAAGVGVRPDNSPDLLRSIASISRESVSAMNDIVWAIDPNRDSLRDLARRMRQYAEQTFVPREIALDFSADDVDDLRLGHEMRRQIYLVFKESVNNAARHSRCAHAEVSLHVGRRRLELLIADDGCGIDASLVRDGNGLRNIRRRAAALGGEVDIRSEPGNGTRISLSVPLHGPASIRR